ncbi:MAG: response regulator transcription factor [Chloroflexi bacterium]|nr:response regulator transcription factor [Chloroflexota bacterium]
MLRSWLVAHTVGRDSAPASSLETGLQRGAASVTNGERGPRVLVVDDEESILDFVELGLRYEGFDVEIARDGPSALEAVAARRPDLMILDLNLPGLDGMEVCRRVRQVSDVPIVMLTARGDVDERVEGLEAGADDYLPKPFKFKELLARVRAVLRRRNTLSERVLRFGDLALNRDTREVFQDGRPVHLTPREFELLEVFLLHPRQVMTREVLLDRVWGTDFLGDGNLIEVHISSLRDKLGDQQRKLIRTVRGIGYALSGA